MTLGIKDTLNFGQYKGRAVDDVIKQDPGYMCWWRDERIKSNSYEAPFDNAANTLLNEQIAKSKALSKRYKQVVNNANGSIEQRALASVSSVVSAQTAQAAAQLSYVERYGEVW